MVDNESQEMYLETILRLKKKKGSVRAIGPRSTAK